MELIIASLAGLPAFAAWFFLSIMLTTMFVGMYTAITPNCEFALIAKGNHAATISLGMSMIGFAIPLSAAILNTHVLFDTLIWGVIAFNIQLLAFLIATLSRKGLAKAIAEGDVSAGLWVGCISVTVGLLNAACMTY